MLILCKSESKFSITSDFAIIVFCKTYYFVNQIFSFIRDFFFVSVFFQKSIRLDSGSRLLLKSNRLSSGSPELAIHRCSRTFYMKANFTRYIFLEFGKIFRTSIFLSTSEVLLLNIPEARSSLL